MKNLTLIILLTVFYNCDTNTQSNINFGEETISNFMDNIIFGDSKTYEDYLDIYNGSEKDRAKIFEVVDFLILAYKDSIKYEKWVDYEIIPYGAIEKHPVITSSKFFKKLEYSGDIDKAYFIVFDNDEDGVNLFVMENSKIISFFPQLHIGSDPIEPYLLNVKH